MSNAVEASFGDRDPLDMKRRSGFPDEMFGPRRSGCIARKGGHACLDYQEVEIRKKVQHMRTREWERTKTHITLECSAVIDRKDQYDVTAVVESFSQDGKIFLLSSPGALLNEDGPVIKSKVGVMFQSREGDEN